ncbi:MAG: TolC family protein [Myxococcaceae bacterium]|nr:TolC family protein [Myxococcaceae bacterium]
MIRTVSICSMALALLPAVALGQQSGRTLTLEEALRTAEQNQPQLRRARASVDVSAARVDEARSQYLPQVNGRAGVSVGAGASVSGGVGAPLSTTRGYNVGVSANQLIWDFGQTTSRIDAARATLAASNESQRATLQDVQLAVRTAYFDALAARALVDVAKEALANQDRHLEQIQAFVEVGTRPEIDLAQVRTDRANARVQLINAENAYETAKAALNQAMGVEGPTDYELADVPPAPVEGEGQELEDLLAEAIRNRPELAALEYQARAEELNLEVASAGYWPSIGASVSADDSGRDLENRGFSASGGLSLTWNLFNGFETRARVQESRAQLQSIEAERDLLRQQVRLELERARLAVRAALASLEASQEAESNARTRLKLAEGRYRAGVGNIIELGDAQVALTQAEAQRVQATYDVSVARAQLLRALGR